MNDPVDPSGCYFCLNKASVTETLTKGFGDCLDGTIEEYEIPVGCRWHEGQVERFLKDSGLAGEDDD